MGAALATPTDAELDGLPHWPSDERTELRWAVEIETWHPGACEWRFLNALLPTVEQTAITKYRIPVDRRRALVSRLLQRRCVAHALGIPDERVVIARTKGNKPFDATHVLGQEETPQTQPPQPQPPQPKPSQRGNFNFNVSHEGHWVVLASDPALLIGVDVSAPFELRGGPKLGDYSEVRETFCSTLSADEWELVERFEPDRERVTAFRRAWSRKESYVKARGDGLAFELARVEFRPCRMPMPAHAPAAPAAPAAPGAPAAPAASAEAAAAATAVAAPSSEGERAVARLASEAAAADAAADAAAGAAAAAAAAVAAVAAVAVARAAAPAPAAEIAAADTVSAEGEPMRMIEMAWAQLLVDGSFAAQWRCSTVELPDGHLISVTRGPVKDAMDSHGRFRSSLERRALPDGEVRARLASPPLPFRHLRLRDLVPPALRPAYEVAVEADRRWPELPPHLRPRLPTYNPSPPPPPPPDPTMRGPSFTPSFILPRMGTESPSPWAPGADMGADDLPTWFNPANGNARTARKTARVDDQFDMVNPFGGRPAAAALGLEM